MQVFIIMYIDGYYPDSIQTEFVYATEEKAEEARRKLFDAEKAYNRVYKNTYESWCEDHEIQPWSVL